MIPNSLAANPYMTDYSLVDINMSNPNYIPSPYRTLQQAPPASMSGQIGHQQTYPHLTPSPSPNELSELNARISQLSSELQYIDNQNGQLRKQMDQYVLTIQKLKQLNNDQQETIQRLNNYREETTGYSQALNQRNLELNNEIQNILVERQMMANRIASEDMMRGREIETLSYRVTQKENQNFDLRKRLSALMDAKARLENDIASTKFSHDNTKSKAELELRERSFRLEQNEKTLLDTIRSRDDEVRHLSERLRGMDQQLRKQRDNQTLLLTKIADQSRICPESTIKSNDKENIRNDNQSNRLVELLEEKDRKLADKDQQLSSLANKLKNLQLKVQAAETTNQTMSKLNEKRQKEQSDRQNQTSMVPNMVKTIKRLRMGIVELVFQVYVNSIDVADKKKSNSLVLFMTNMQDFARKEGRQLKVSIDAYEDTRKSIEHYVNTKATSNEVKNELMSSIGKFTADEGQTRDKMNKWIQGTIVYTVQQRRIDKSDKNKEMLFLFRLLTIKYRLVYPIKGQQIRVDGDLGAILESKIVGTVKHFVSKGPDA